MSEHMSGQSWAQTTRTDFTTPSPENEKTVGVYQTGGVTPALLLLGGALSRRCLGGLGARGLGAGGNARAGHAEAILEALYAATAVDALAHARPGRMGLGIDIEAHLRAFLAPGRLRLERRAVGHDHRNLVV